MVEPLWEACKAACLKASGERREKKVLAAVQAFDSFRWAAKVFAPSGEPK